MGSYNSKANHFAVEPKMLWECFLKFRCVCPDSNDAIQSDRQIYRGASFVSFAPPGWGEGRDEGSRLTFNGVISHLPQNEILRLPTTLNRTRTATNS